MGFLAFAETGEVLRVDRSGKAESLGQLALPLADDGAALLPIVLLGGRELFGVVGLRLGGTERFGDGEQMRLLIRNKVQGRLCRLLGVDDVVGGLRAGVLSGVGRSPNGGKLAIRRSRRGVCFFDRLCLKINCCARRCRHAAAARRCRRGLWPLCSWDRR